MFTMIFQTIKNQVYWWLSKLLWALDYGMPENQTNWQYYRAFASMSCDYGKDFLEELKWGNRISSMHNTKHHPHFLVHFRTENSDSFFTKIQIFLCRKQKKTGGGWKKEKEKGSLKWFKAYFCSGDVAMCHVTDRVALYKVILKKRCKNEANHWKSIIDT